MWPFLLILAIVPLIFFWSDAVRDVFPVLSDWLPESAEEHVLIVEEDEDGSPKGFSPSALEGSLDSQWVISHTDEGYVAWTISSGGKYRLAVGCYPGATGTIQATHVSGKALSRNIVVNYQYGHIPLTEGFYSGPMLVEGVAQFSEVYLQTPAGAVLAQFKVPGYVSGAIAREVQSICARE